MPPERRKLRNTANADSKGHPPHTAAPSTGHPPRTAATPASARTPADSGPGTRHPELPSDPSSTPASPRTPADSGPGARRTESPVFRLPTPSDRALLDPAVSDQPSTSNTLRNSIPTADPGHGKSAATDKDFRELYATYLERHKLRKLFSQDNPTGYAPTLLSETTLVELPGDLLDTVTRIRNTYATDLKDAFRQAYTKALQDMNTKLDDRRLYLSRKYGEDTALLIDAKAQVVALKLKTQREQHREKRRELRSDMDTHTHDATRRLQNHRPGRDTTTRPAPYQKRKEEHPHPRERTRNPRAHTRHPREHTRNPRELTRTPAEKQRPRNSRNSTPRADTRNSFNGPSTHTRKPRIQKHWNTTNLESTLIIGDSHAKRLIDHLKPTENINIIAIPGTTTLELIKLIRDGELILPAAKRIYTLVGTNDMLNGTQTPEMEGRYLKLRKMMSENTRTDSLEHLPPPSFPADKPNEHFETVASLMANGTLITFDHQAFHTSKISKDGVHLHRHEYRFWLQAITKLTEN